MIFQVSSDGRTIKILHKNPEVRQEFSYNDLKQNHWKEYNFAAKFVHSIRKQTPKITIYTNDGAVCRLMENLPEPNFEMSFHESKVKICYPSDKDIQIEWPGTLFACLMLHSFDPYILMFATFCSRFDRFCLKLNLDVI